MARTQRQIQRDMINSAINRGVGQYVGAGSVLYELTGVQAYQLAEAEKKVDEAVRNSHLTEAVDSALDRWGADLDLPRLPSQRAQAYTADRSVRLFTTTGANFEDLAGGAPVLAVGQRLTITDGTKSYLITDVISGYETSNQVFVGVQAVEDGSAGNTPPRTITRHFLSGYEGSVQVENIYGIYNGANKETNEQFRARLKRRQLQLESCNETAIENYVLQFAGVGKFRVIFNYKGAGTTAVIVQPTLGILNTGSFLNSIQRAVRDRVSAGSQIIVKNPELRYASLETVLRTVEPLNVTQKQILVNRVKTALLNYLNKLAIGDDLNITTMERIILSSDSRISSIGDSGHINVIRLAIKDSVSTYTEVVPVGTRSYGIAIDELIVLDDENPITISVV